MIDRVVESDSVTYILAKRILLFFLMSCVAKLDAEITLNIFHNCVLFSPY